MQAYSLLSTFYADEKMKSFRHSCDKVAMRCDDKETIMPKLSDLTKLLKAFAKNPSISDEEFLNALLLPYVIAGKIRNKNKEEFSLNKSRTSKIMNQKEDVPSKLREALSIYGIIDETKEEMRSFIDDYIDSGKTNNLIQRLNELMPQTSQVINNAVDNNDDVLPGLITDILIRSLSETNLSVSDVETIWKHGINSVDMQTGDIFHYGFGNRHKKKNIVVIPVNTAFDTHVTRKIENNPYPLVSENTVHGQWLIRMKESGVQPDQLDKRITESLSKHGFTPVKNTKCENLERLCYPIGAVAIIETDNAIYFLVAISRFDTFNNARSTSGDINEALRSILDIYDRAGLGYDMYLPLMGTGLSRAGLSTQEAYDLLTEQLICNSSKIHGHIHIILKPEDRREIVIRGGE